jgi:hypothetical protein
MSFAAKLKEEIANTEAELASDPRWIRLQALRDMLRLYEFDPGVDPKGPLPLVNIKIGTRKRESTSRERKKALEIAKALLAPGDKPVTTAVIYQAILRAGVHIAGKKPKNNLSSMLYHTPDFLSHGRLGWTLRRDENNASPVSTEETR